MKGLFKEKLEYYKASLTTKEGLFEYLIGSYFWGFILVNYNDIIYNKILNLLTFLDGGALKNYVAYLIFGTILVPLGLIITFLLTSLYKTFFKNGRTI